MSDTDARTAQRLRDALNLLVARQAITVRDADPDSPFASSLRILFEIDAIEAREVETLAEQNVTLARRVSELYDALQLAAGIRHDMDAHRNRYLDCEVPGCVQERAALGAVSPTPDVPEYAAHPEFVPEWDIHRDEHGNAVTVDCDYGYYDGPPLTDEQLTAVRRAVEVHRLVCEAENDGQHAGALVDGVFSWKQANAAKSRLLGRMIHDGLPPTRTKPPKLYSEPRWDLMEGGDPFAAAVSSVDAEAPQ